MRIPPRSHTLTSDVSRLHIREPTGNLVTPQSKNHCTSRTYRPLPCFIRRPTPTRHRAGCPMSRSWDMGFHVTPIASDPSELLIHLMQAAASITHSSTKKPLRTKPERLFKFTSTQWLRGKKLSLHHAQNAQRSRTQQHQRRRFRHGGDAGRCLERRVSRAVYRERPTTRCEGCC